MKKIFRVLSLAFVTFPLLAAAPNPEHLDTFKVREGMSAIYVDTRASYPPEIDNETQQRALAKDAAVAMGQNAILQHILQKKTRKGLTLGEAQVPSTEMQDNVKALISGARVESVRFDKDGCRVRMWVDKANLKVILKKG